MITVVDITLTPPSQQLCFYSLAHLTSDFCCTYANIVVGQKSQQNLTIEMLLLNLSNFSKLRSLV